MRVAVYDRNWATAGGGEAFAAGIATSLATAHDVTLLGPGPLSRRAIADRLGLDLDALHVEQSERVPRRSEPVAFDLLVNISHQSSDPCPSAHGIYVAMFPTEALPGSWSGPVDVVAAHGLGLPEPARPGPIRWTDGEAVLHVYAPAGEVILLVVLLGRHLPRDAGPTPVTIRAGDMVTTTVVRPAQPFDPRRVVPVPLRLTGTGPDPVEVAIESPTFAAPAPDTRRLGVPVLGVTRGRARAAAARLVPRLARQPDALGFLDTYDVVVANSEYSARWIETRWGRQAFVLTPPVAPRPRGEKGPIILSVGRFFPPGRDHAKKQVELVEAFRSLHAIGLTDWSLHLVGGVAEGSQDYVDDVRRAARGLPVTLHPDAAPEVRDDLYARASIYWHGAGIGESPRLHPERFEHFGIAPVEAMSAGAVPIVVGVGGPAGVVEHGRTGFHYTTSAGLVAHTERLIGDEDLWTTMSVAAQVAARDHGPEPFRRRLLALVRDLGAAS